MVNLEGLREDRPAMRFSVQQVIKVWTWAVAVWKEWFQNHQQPWDVHRNFALASLSRLIIQEKVCHQNKVPESLFLTLGFFFPLKISLPWELFTPEKIQTDPIKMLKLGFSEDPPSCTWRWPRFWTVSMTDLWNFYLAGPTVTVN